MDKRVIFAAVLLVALAAVVVGAVNESTELTRPGIIRITNREELNRSVDMAPHGKSPGDLTIRSALLFNRSIPDHALGHEEVVCTYLGSGSAFGSGARNCVITFYLPRGKIVVEGTLHNQFIYELPVVGGTRLYNNVRGSLTVTYLASAPRRELLYFRLTI